MLKKLNNFTFYNDFRFYSSFPSIVKLDNNQLLLVFRRARDVRHLIDKESEDNEEILLLKNQVDHVDSRSQLVSIRFDQALSQIGDIMPLPADPEAADQDASLLVLQNGNILLSSFSWYPIPSRIAPLLVKKGVSIYGNIEGTGCLYILWGGFTRLSENNGLSWSNHKYLPHLPTANEIIPGKRHSCGGTPRGQAIEVNGEILLPVYRYLDTFKTSTSHLYVSRDNGKSWIYRSTIAADHRQTIYFQEPSLIQCRNGNIMAFMRTANAGDHLYTTVSDNNGKSWNKPIPREEVIGHPIHPLKLNDGRIFISYGYRHKPFGIRGRLMDENGEKFIGDEITIRDDASCGDIGYPWAVQLDNNDILVVYYFTGDDGIRFIAGTTIKLI
jgi:BNR repeat-like domain